MTEAGLWVAVLAAGLHDAARGKDADWIGSRDFAMVCALAGFDPDAVRQRFTGEGDLDTMRRALARAA